LTGPRAHDILSPAQLSLAAHADPVEGQMRVDLADGEVIPDGDKQRSA